MPDDINRPNFVSVPNSFLEADLFSGEIRNSKTLRVLRPRLVKSSSRYYFRVKLTGGVSVAVQRLIMAAHLGRALEKHEQVRHINGDPTFNGISNLRLGTARDNAADKYADNTAGRVLRNAQVYEIRALGRRLPVRVIAERYNVSRAHVRAIKSGRRWSGLR